MLVNFLAYVNYLVIRQQCKSIWNFEVQYFKIAVPAICEPQIVYICFQFKTNIIVVGVVVGVQWVVWLAINKSLIIYLRGVAMKVRVQRTGLFKMKRQILVEIFGPTGQKKQKWIFPFEFGPKFRNLWHYEKHPEWCALTKEFAWICLQSPIHPMQKYLWQYKTIAVQKYLLQCKNSYYSSFTGIFMAATVQKYLFLR